MYLNICEHKFFVSETLTSPLVRLLYSWRSVCSNSICCSSVCLNERRTRLHSISRFTIGGNGSSLSDTPLVTFDLTKLMAVSSSSESESPPAVNLESRLRDRFGLVGPAHIQTNVKRVSVNYVHVIRSNWFELSTHAFSCYNSAILHTLTISWTNSLADKKLFFPKKQGDYLPVKS